MTNSLGRAPAGRASERWRRLDGFLSAAEA